MATAYPLPDLAKIKDVLGMLFDNLVVKPGGKFDQTPAGGAWFGVFVTDAGVPVAMCGADANLAATLLSAPNGHAEFEVQLPRYGGGILSVVST